MAIYHFNMKVLKRSRGRSTIAAAAYRSASRLYDERMHRNRDYTHKTDVIHSEILLPESAPAQYSDREKLWNAVEAAEKRKDAQLAREIVFAIPPELTHADAIQLAREFTRREFVNQGMIADLNVHWGTGPREHANPHAHVLLTTREVGEEGFRAKARHWDLRKLLRRWRESWANHVNARLAELDIDARIDHRSLKAQGIRLEPKYKISLAALRMQARGLEPYDIARYRDIVRRNNARIIANPSIALDAITHTQATFTRRDLAMFIHRNSDDREQFEQALRAVNTSPDLIMLGKDGRGESRFTSREMLESEQRLHRASDIMAQREWPRVPSKERDAALVRAERRGIVLSSEQRSAFEHLMDARDLGVVVGHAGTGKTLLLGTAREAWEAGGNNVRGLTLSGVAAENLENGSDIKSRTIAAQEYQWDQRRELLTPRDVLVIDEAGMVGTRQMERILSHAAEAGAKIVLVGDPQQLQAIEAGAAFRAICERHGSIEIGEVRRQRDDWQREATYQFATGCTEQALQTYAEHGMVHETDTREEARYALIESWNREHAATLSESRIILAHTNDDVRDLNELARAKLRDAGELGDDVLVEAERGERSFASGDRIMFLRNDRNLEVKNGTLGTIEEIGPGRISVRTDDGRSVAFDIKDYSHVDHGYAATIHKAQGMTVDRSHVLATPGMDSHSAYVALSRHREAVRLHYGRDDFADLRLLVRTLSRERGKDMATDYERIDPARGFAERRGITFRERFVEIARQVPARTRSIFAKFRPSQQVPEVATSEHQRTGTTDQRRAIERYARAIEEIRRMRGEDLPILPHQQEAHGQARDALNAIRPDAANDLDAAFERQPGLVREAARGGSTAALRAMQIEAEIRTDPFQRANRFVKSWRHLRRQHRELVRDNNIRAAQKIAQRMSDMAKNLERDPQLESLLRGRSREFGLELEATRKLSERLAASVPFCPTRHRGLGI